jgi:hypothetical protein
MVVDRDLLRRVVGDLSRETLSPLVFGGWASELLGLEEPRSHNDIDLLVVAPTLSVNAFLAARDEVVGKRFSHKRAFIEDGELVELFLVDAASGTTRFWDAVEVVWPSRDPVVIDDLPVVSASVLRMYQDRYAQIHAERP